MIIADSPYKVKPNLYFNNAGKLLLHTFSTNTIYCGNNNVNYVYIDKYTLVLTDIIPHH